jgi:hypothetical protein
MNKNDPAAEPQVTFDRDPFPENFSALPFDEQMLAIANSFMKVSGKTFTPQIFLQILASLKFKGGGATLPKNDFLRSLTVHPPGVVAKYLISMFNERPELLMQNSLTRETLSRALDSTFNLDGGHFTIHEVTWGESEVKAQSTFHLFEAPAEASKNKLTIDGKATNILPRIFFRPDGCPWEPKPEVRSLCGKVTVIFEPKNVILEMTECSLNEKQH